MRKIITAVFLLAAVMQLGCSACGPMPGEKTITRIQPLASFFEIGVTGQSDFEFDHPIRDSSLSGNLLYVDDTRTQFAVLDWSLFVIESDRGSVEYRHSPGKLYTGAWTDQLERDLKHAFRLENEPLSGKPSSEWVLWNAAGQPGGNSSGRTFITFTHCQYPDSREPFQYRRPRMLYPEGGFTKDLREIIRACMGEASPSDEVPDWISSEVIELYGITAQGTYFADRDNAHAE